MVGGVGGFGAVYYLLRLAIRNPDVSWSRVQNPEPNQEYHNKQYKVKDFLILITSLSKYIFLIIFPQFYSPVRDYSKIESKAPKY